MGRAKNTLKGSEVSSTPIKLRYSVTYASNSLDEYGIAIVTGSNIPYSVNMSPEEMESMNNYRMIRQLYYQQEITGSLGTSSFWDPFWVSTAASGTYDATRYDFPTEITSSILICAIPSSQFGEQISRKSFALASTPSSTNQFMLVDDGNGNILDTLDGNVKVGNIFYAQGIAVITNRDYVIGPAVTEYLVTQLDENIVTQIDDEIII